ncbi:hypothetical protein K6M90_01625 [Rhizobium sp. 9T]|uniref:hypothetical protein n=1 Tax=Rhizobium croatiense TaxID=2867516 RepID=UPI001C935AA2|nr:hypothetical protein [Rhizobium croatiense]MBY4606374.1 hypothetical protein [Rhizobium croatiense]
MLEIKIDGRWEPNDFIAIFQAIESFYYKLAVASSRGDYDLPYWLYEDHERRAFSRFDGVPFEVVLDRINLRMLERARYQTPARFRIAVAKIQYASPGGIDLLGIGKVFETLSNSIGRMKSYYDDAALREERDAQAALDTQLKMIEVEKEKENLQALKIKNAEDALRILDARPELQAALVPLLVRDQDAISSLIAEQKVISARVADSDRDLD